MKIIIATAFLGGMLGASKWIDNRDKRKQQKIEQEQQQEQRRREREEQEEQSRRERAKQEEQQKEQRYRDQRINEAKEIEAYMAIKPLQERAKSICRKWTNSSCERPDDLIAFIRLYALQRGAYKHPSRVKVRTNQTLQDETKAVHEFAKRYMDFYRSKNDFLSSGFCGYRAHQEYKEFLTFHWAVYTANKVSAELHPYERYDYGNLDRATHTKVYKSLQHMSTCFVYKPDMDEVFDFQHKVRPHFEIIHKEIFKRA